MLILASASPRRAELLTQAGFTYTVVPADIDETPLPGEAAAVYVQRLAVEKAQAVCALYKDKQTDDDPLMVLAADTAVVLQDGSILGKPFNAAAAAGMLSLISGRTHAVMTGLAVVTTARTCSDVEITQVTVNLIPQYEIDTYTATSEPLDKAGAYAIQGYAARWIPRIEGDYFNVVGLPIARIVAMIAEAGQPDVAEPGASTT